ncbi:MAG: response regulator [Candidatus Hydrogenedentes bacterium]|nr:response regulator [Candidatus Hydrogenedentota bacterium]
MEIKQSFSTSEVAKYCHVTPDTIRKWAEAGRIHVFKTPGGHRRIRREDLLQFLRENSIPIHGDLDTSGLRILIVDCERTVAAVIRRFLERTRNSFQIEVAHDGFELGQLVSTFRPDIVFLEARVPGHDGYELCRRIKGMPDLPNVRIILMASIEEGDSISRGAEHGASVSLAKPFTPDDLRRALARVGIEVS